MTLATTDSRISYSGDGTVTSFAFPYYFINDADLKVYVRDTNGTETLQTITTDYSVTGAGVASGGSVTMVTPPGATDELIIYRDPAIKQETDLVENDSLPAESVETAYDLLTMICQRLGDRVNRGITLSEAYTATFNMELPSVLTADKALIVNSTGDGWAMGPDAADIAAAATEAAAAAASAAAALTSENNASTSESNAAASAAAAQTAANSILWSDIRFLTSVDSPYTVSDTNRGELLSIDTSGGAVTVNLPSIAALDLTSPFTVAFKKTSADGNAITINRNGTDTIDGGTSKTVTQTNFGTTLIAEDSVAPDDWTSSDFGAAGGNFTVDAFSGDGTVTDFTVSVSPGSENNTQVYISGVYQNKSVYSLTGSIISFSSAPPTGTNNIEVISGTSLAVGTPADASITRAKLTQGAVAQKSVRAISADDNALSTDDVITVDVTGGTVTVTLPPVSGLDGKELILKKSVNSANLLVADGNGVETVDGAASQSSNQPWGYLHLICDESNSNWLVIGEL